MTRALPFLVLLAGCLSTPPPAAFDARAGDDVIDAGPDSAIDGDPSDWTLTAISAGQDHVCAIDSETRLYCWGSNRHGQLGIDDLVNARVTAPAEVGGTGWTAIAAGADHTCGIRDGGLYCWGDNSQGETADEDHGGGDVTGPEPVDSGPTTGWIAVSAGSGFTCGIVGMIGAAQVYCWGSDYDEQLGSGAGNATAPTVTAIAMTSEGTAPDDWVGLSAGHYHACAVRNGGELYCWGSNGGGELGDGTTTPRSVPTRVIASTDTGEVFFGAIAAGGVVTCALGHGTGILYCWGNNGYQQLGIDGLVEARDPRRVGVATDWSAISMSYAAVCGRRGGDVYCWGDGQRGAIGQGDWDFESTPTAVDGITDATAIATGYHSACATLAGGGARCWGDNPEGELGNGESSSKHLPALVAPAGGWSAVSAGDTHTCGVHDGVVQCWGWNQAGQLAPPITEGTATPASVAGIGAGTATAVAAGSVSSCALIDDAPWCWGHNLNGQVGSGPAGPVKVPTMVASATWTRLAATDQAVCGVTGTTRSCWGIGDDYQQGNNAVTQVLAPTAADAASWTEVSLGFHFGCGIQTGGALACWGSDAYGQQGDGATETTAMTPHVIAAGTSFTEVGAAWGDHACAIVDNGDLQCWGRNDYAQTGQSTGSTITSPTVVAGAGDWTAISAGSAHTCGVKDGGLYCWGTNYEGQLGIDDGNDYADTPTRVGTASDWTAVSAGTQHTCALRGGDLYCWGTNVHGQLGDGTSAHDTPQAVVAP